LSHQKKLWLLIDDVLTSCLSLKSQKEAKDKNKPGSLIRELLLPIVDTLFQLPPPSAFFLYPFSHQISHQNGHSLCPMSRRLIEEEYERG